MARSQVERLWLTGGGLVAFVMVLIGYFFFISPQREDTSSVNAQVSTAQLQNQSLQQHIDALTAQNKELPKYQAAYKQAQLALPSTSGLPDFLRTLQSIGNATLANVSALTVGPPTDLTTAAAAPATTTTSPSTAPVASADAAGPHVYALSITAQVSGSVGQLGQFLTQLQAVQPRAVLISQITEGSESSASTGKTAGGASTLQLTMQAFVAPSSAVENAALAQASRP